MQVDVKLVDAVQGTTEALNNHLFIHGWALERKLARMQEAKSGNIAMAYADGEPVGVCVCYANQMMVFVKKEFRMKGIGQRLVSLLKTTLPKDKDIYAEYGVAGSQTFWRKQHVDVI